MSNLRVKLNTIDLILKKISKIPSFIVLLVMAIGGIGVTILYSAAQGNMYPWAIKQLTYFLLFLPLMLVVALVNIKTWYRLSYLSYLVVLVLLLLMELFGHRAMGAVRWINLGFIKLQPSELMKICLVLALARYFHTVSYYNIKHLRYLLVPFVIVFVPFLLILKQPDLGTAFILLTLGGMMFFATGVSLWLFSFIVFAAASLMPFLWYRLHPYQKKRIFTFLNPEHDALGAGYNIIQSKIAIGSGGLWGKGLINGTQSQLDFLPEHQTDFVFTMLAEELGFVCCSMIIIFYGIIIAFGVYTAINARNHYAKLVAIGTVSLFFLHVFINISMVMGLVPVVGVPLPLLSYGGTITLTTLVGIGLLINCHIHNNSYIGGEMQELL